jgi:hypothetical protein
MRIQLIFASLLYSIGALAIDDKSMQELFKKYELVMDQKKVELIEEVFTEKFIKDSGGKDELIKKIKELPSPLQAPQTKWAWKKGHKGKIYLANLKEVSVQKKKTDEAQFIVLEIDGKPKIDGTISDPD